MGLLGKPDSCADLRYFALASPNVFPGEEIENLEAHHFLNKLVNFRLRLIKWD